MTIDEINERKEQLKYEHTVPEILNRYGVKVNRGRCKAICHDGQKYTAKISDGLYFCFKCNKTMDIFDIVMHFTSCDFWTAFEILGGTEEVSFATYRKTRVAILEREKVKEELRKKNMKLREVSTCIGFYQRILKRTEPMSDKWCNATNDLQYQLYLFEIYNERG